MSGEDGRVTILPKQISRLADFTKICPHAIEILQRGSVLQFNDGETKVTIDAEGRDIPPPNQESLC